MTSPKAEPTPPESWLELPDGKLFWLGGRCGIGRQGDNDLVLEDTALSRHHALLVAEPAGYTLTDLRSSNGTYLNRVPVTRPVPVRDGDEIRLGDVALRFRCHRREGTRGLMAAPDVTRRVEDTRPRTCWFLLADIAGYSRLIAESGNETATFRLRAWIAGVRQVIEQFGGHINSYVGDGVFAWWPDEPGVSATVQNALQVLDDYRHRSPLLFRVVLHHGEALLSHSDRGEEMTGRDVNFVFRSEKIAKRLGVDTMLSEAAVEALGLAGHCAFVGTSAVEGIEGRFNFFRPPPARGAAP